MRWETVAEFSFIGGVILAFLIGAMPTVSDYQFSLVILLGCVVGLINIFDKEVEKFTGALNTILIATVAFYVLSAVTSNPNGMLLFFKNISASIALFVGPVAFIMGVVDVYEIAMNYKKDKEKVGKKKK
jgi:hypothetical protein